MKKITAFFICTFFLFTVTAQPVFNATKFKTELNNIINSAPNSFGFIPENYKLEGATNYTIIKKKEFAEYQANYATNISLDSANKMETFLTEQIKLALDNKFDISRIVSFDQNSTYINFTSQCGCNIVLVHLRIEYSKTEERSIHLDVRRNKETKYLNIENYNVVRKINNIIVETLGIEEYKLSNDACFKRDLGADDFDFVEIIMYIKSMFKIAIPDEDAKCIKTYGQLIDYVEMRIN